MGKRVVDRELRRQRPALIVGIVVSFPVAVALWLGVYYGLPPSAIEAVSHERLRSPAIDPLSGYTTRRITINLRYLQNTLEQLLLFISGLLMLAYYCSNGSAMRAVVATTAVWIIARGAFWIGYHYGSQYRAIGAPGMMQSILVLLYVCGRFGFDVAGIAGAAAPLVLFFCIEAYLFYATRSRRPPIR